MKKGIELSINDTPKNAVKNNKPLQAAQTRHHVNRKADHRGWGLRLSIRERGKIKARFGGRRWRKLKGLSR